MTGRPGLFSRWNQRILAVLDRRAGRTRLCGVSVSEGGIDFEYVDHSRRHLAWPAVRRIGATRRDIFAGELLCVLIESSEPGVFEVPSSVEGWTELCSRLDALPGARPRVQWTPEALSVPVGTLVEIWTR